MCLERSLLQGLCVVCGKGRAKSCMIHFRNVAFCKGLCYVLKGKVCKLHLCVGNVAISKGCVLCVEGEELRAVIHDRNIAFCKGCVLYA